MKKLNLLLTLVLLIINTALSQTYPIRVRVKENIITTDQHINTLTESLRSNTVFNNASFKQIEIDLEKSGLNWFQMDTAQLNELSTIAIQTEVYGSENAKAVLALLDHNPERAYSMPIAQHSEQRLSTQKSYKNIPVRKLMSVSPNPANGIVYVSYELPDTFKSVVLNIHNAQGQL